jgi:Protein of unknown function (DUF2726)
VTDKSKQRARAFARANGISHQAAANQLRAPLKKLNNQSEARVEALLDPAVIANGARVCPKVRLADVLPIEGSGISDPDYSYALKAHLDFLVRDRDENPLFAVEYDGGGHDDANDATKNRLCEHFGLPLARIERHHLDLQSHPHHAVQWLVEVFFLGREFEEAQAQGHIPPDEAFDPALMARDTRFGKDLFPLAFTKRSRLGILAAQQADQIPRSAVFHFVVWVEDRATAVTVLRVGPNRFLAARASIYLNGFAITASDVAHEFAYEQLGRSLRAWLDGRPVAQDGPAVQAKLLPLVRVGTVTQCGGSLGDLDGFEMRPRVEGKRIVYELLGPRR